MVLGNDFSASSALMSLPPELHLLITEQLPWWDTYALRMTCHLLYSLLPPLPKNSEVPSQPEDVIKLKDSFFMVSNNLNTCLGCMGLHLYGHGVNIRGEIYCYVCAQLKVSSLLAGLR